MQLCGGENTEKKTFFYYGNKRNGNLVWHIYTMRPFASATECRQCSKTLWQCVCVCVRMHECNFNGELFVCCLPFAFNDSKNCNTIHEHKKGNVRLLLNKKKLKAHPRKCSKSDYANIYICDWFEWPIKDCNRVEREHKRSITFSCFMFSMK